MASNAQFKWHGRHPLTSACPTLINNFFILKKLKGQRENPKSPHDLAISKKKKKKLFESIKSS